MYHTHATKGYTVGGFATLTRESTPTCEFDGSFFQTVSISPKCISTKFVLQKVQLVGFVCVSSFSFNSCFQSVVIQMHMLFGSRPLAVRLICSVVSLISRFVKASADRSGCRHQKFKVGKDQKKSVNTVASIGHKTGLSIIHSGSGAVLVHLQENVMATAEQMQDALQQ